MLKPLPGSTPGPESCSTVSSCPIAASLCRDHFSGTAPGSGLAGSCVASRIVLACRAAGRKRARPQTGTTFPLLWTSIALTSSALPFLRPDAWRAFPSHWELPVLRGFNFAGGTRGHSGIHARCSWLYLIYTGGLYCGSRARPGIRRWAMGQTEAALALAMAEPACSGW